MAKRTTCPECSLEGKYKKNVGIYEDHLYCFRCEQRWDLDEDIKAPLKLVTINSESVTDNFAISKKHLNNETVKAFKVLLHRKVHLDNPVVDIPAALEFKYGASSKLKTPDKEYIWVNYKKPLPMFGEHLHDASRKNIVITEGEEDAMAVWQSLGHGGSRSINHVTSLPTGVSTAAAFIKEHYEKLVQYETITLCFDMDEPGQKGLQKIIPMFSKNKLRIVKFPEKDACDMLVSGKEEELKWAVLKAESIVPKGIVRMSELSTSFFDYTPPEGIQLPFPLLDKYLGNLRKGELTMVAGGSGLSKSTFVSNIVYDMITTKGLKVVDIKLEEDKHRTIYGYAGMYFNDRKYVGNPTLLTSEQRQEFKDKFSNYITYDHFGSLTTGELLNVLEYFALSEKVDFIMLDHISIAISGTQSSKEGERKDIDILVTKIRELINTSNVGFICVSHLSNPSSNGVQWEEGRKVNRSSLRGSGALAQLSDNIIGIEGNLIEDATKNLRQIRLLKTRYGREQEVLCDSFKYDYNSGRIYVVNDIFEDVSDE